MKITGKATCVGTTANPDSNSSNNGKVFQISGFLFFVNFD
jgi:hypothetical protein